MICVFFFVSFVSLLQQREKVQASKKPIREREKMMRSNARFKKRRKHPRKKKKKKVNRERKKNHHQYTTRFGEERTGERFDTSYSVQGAEDKREEKQENILVDLMEKEIRRKTFIFHWIATMFDSSVRSSGNQGTISSSISFEQSPPDVSRKNGILR